MVIYTDSEGFARKMFPEVEDWRPVPSPAVFQPVGLRTLAARLFRDDVELVESRSRVWAADFVVERAGPRLRVVIGDQKRTG